MLAKHLLPGIAVLALGVPVAASEDAKGTYPNLQIVVPIELKWSNTFEAEKADDEVSDLYVEIEPDITIGINEWLSVNFGLVFENTEDPEFGEDRVFENQGLFVETAQAIASFGQLTVNAGKFTAPFSIAYQYVNGFYGDKLNEEIEVSERWGVGAAYNLTGDGTEQGVILRAAAFNRDTSFLSGSVFSNRGRFDRSDGGNGNTDGLDNVAVALDVIHWEGLPEFHFHAAYMFQKAGDGDVSDQNAYVFGVNWDKEISDNAAYEVLVEWAHSDGALGYADAESAPGAAQDDFTMAVSGKWYKKWKGSIGYSLRDIDDPTGGDEEVRLFNAAIGYYIDKNWMAEIAYMNLDKDDKDSQSVGLKLSTEFEWSAH